MDSVAPPNTAMTALEHTHASHNLEQRLEHCLECINANGRFQVALWHSRGEITDSLLK